MKALKVIRDSQEFILEIEKLVREKGLNYLDALMHYVELHSVDPELVASIVKKNPNLKGKLQEDCMKLNLVEKILTIPGL
jgi:hypothetical protein